MHTKLVGKPKMKRALGSARCRWANNKAELKNNVWSADVDWIHLPQDTDRRRALVKIVMNFRVP
jgi:hypothetical protein